MTIAGPRCADCGAQLLTARSKRCPRCAIAHARDSRRGRPSRRPRPNAFAVQTEAARLPEVLEHYREEWER